MTTNTETIKTEMHLYAVWNQYEKRWDYHASDCATMDTVGWVLIESKPVEFARPSKDADWSAGAIELTRMEQKKVRAEAEAKCIALEDRIQSMLCLENKS